MLPWLHSDPALDRTSHTCIENLSELWHRLAPLVLSCFAQEGAEEEAYKRLNLRAKLH